MANRKVALVRYCKTEQGWRRYPVVMGGNGRVRPGYVMIDGQPVANDTGHYELRFYAGSQLKYTNVGTNAADALASCIRQQKLLAVRDDAREAGAVLVEEPGRTTLASAQKAFVGAAEDRGSVVAAGAYKNAVTGFLRVIGKAYADEITAEDFTRFQKALVREGQSERTVSNKHKLVVAFAKFAGVPSAILPRKAPKYDVTLPQVYTREQLQALFTAIDSDYHRVVFTLLLQTGLREQEAMYLTWADIDFERKTLLVRSKPDLGFRIKDREERAIPLSDGLVELLKSYREQNPQTTFVTGAASGKPNSKLLRTLKRLAYDAGLNCGACASCADRNECESWFLHKFRATYITTMLRSGLDLRSVMQLSGHSDLESVMRYLRPAEGEELRVRVNAVKWVA